MADADRAPLAKPPRQAVVYLYPAHVQRLGRGVNPRDTTFVFQYWPESLSDSHPVNITAKEIPGGSHPLYQWTGSGERAISFDAVFTSEVDDAQRASHGNIPSARFTVDIKAAIAKIESWKLGSYRLGGSNGRVIPPPTLILVVPGSNLGRSRDEVPVVLKDVSWSYESWFPDGTPRVVQASFQFGETVQTASSAGSGSKIKFIGRDDESRGYNIDLLRRYNPSLGSFPRVRR